ncbi:uncharacterized protein LOC144572859 [Carex rostrata]
MNELVGHSTLWEYEEPSQGREPHDDSSPDQTTPVPEAPDPDPESPVLVAAKKGITEIVVKILRKYPVAIFDQDKDAKNILLLAVEHRQTKKGTVLSALHLAAKLSDSRLWSTGAAIRLQWEIKWYKYVQSSMRIMGRGRSTAANHAGKMPEEVFIETHDALIKEGIKGLTNTCQLSCSVVAALFVAFQSVSAVPGGVAEQFGFPILIKKTVFQLFAISSVLSLCFSVTSVFVFLSIIISNFKVFIKDVPQQVWDFENKIPVKLILGQTSLFMAIVSTLVAFCAGDFYVFESLKFGAYLIYAIMCFSVTYFAAEHYPLYINLIKQTIKKVAKPEMVQDDSG